MLPDGFTLEFVAALRLIGRAMRARFVAAVRCCSALASSLP